MKKSVTTPATTAKEIPVKCTPAQFEALNSVASRYDMSVGDMLVALSCERLEGNSIDEEDGLHLPAIAWKFVGAGRVPRIDKSW